MHTNDRNPARACESLITRLSSSADERRGLWHATGSRRSISSEEVDRMTTAHPFGRENHVQ